MTKKIKLKLIIKKNEEKEQYSNSKTLILTKPSLKNVRKRKLFKIYKSEASKTKVPYVKNHLQKKISRKNTENS